MPNSRFSQKEDRQVSHIAASERARGVPARKAMSIGYGRVVNQQKGCTTNRLKASNFRPKKEKS